MEYKICSKCGEKLPATKEYFPWQEKGRTLRSYCKICRKIAYREYYLKNKEKIDAGSKIWHMEHKERCKIKRKEYETRNAEKLRKYRQANKEKIYQTSKLWAKNNPQKVKQQQKRYNDTEKRKIYLKEYFQKNKKQEHKKSKRYMNSKAYFKTYAQRLTIEEDPKDDGNGYLLVKCAYCGKYFYPTVSKIRGRIYGLSQVACGENRLYCSKGCKKACPIFNRQRWPKGFKPATSREVDPLIRQMCLKRDDYTCQRCGKTIEETELHSHHIEGAVQQPMLANDIENTITLCKECHKWVHKQNGCTRYDLRCKK